MLTLAWHAGFCVCVMYIIESILRFSGIGHTSLTAFIHLHLGSATSTRVHTRRPLMLCSYSLQAFWWMILSHSSFCDSFIPWQLGGFAWVPPPPRVQTWSYNFFPLSPGGSYMVVFLKWVLYCDVFSRPPKNASFGDATSICSYFSTEKNPFGGQ